MLFVSLIFLFIFLPLVLFSYYLLKKHRKAQNYLLFFCSIFFYAWGEPKYVFLLILSIVCNWYIAILIHKCQDKDIQKFWLIVSIVINIGLLFIFKYLYFFVNQINKIGILNISIHEIALPIGISFFTFQALSYVIDVYRGEKCQYNLLDVGLYISFFPQLIAGPIVRYKSIEYQITNRKETIEKFKYGVIRFIQGFIKKVLLANTLAVIADKAFDMLGNNLTASFAWLGAISYSLQIYYDFSGYSDMAIGLGKMFGFDFDENFYYPYMSSSITEFWRRWHISLSAWFRDYVYIPLGGNRSKKPLRNYFNLFIVWLLTGIWHGANWTFVVWGLLFFAFQMLEKATPYGKFIKEHKVIARIYTLFVVSVLWIIFRSNNISQALLYIKTMFGHGGIKITSTQTLIYIKENIVYLFFAVIFSTDIAIKIKKIINQYVINKKLMDVAISICYESTLIILFIISIVYIINGAYNPFIYFHF